MADPFAIRTSRSCGDCSLCCKVLGIIALDKPMHSWCPHCKPGQGCGIYETRPTECRTFSCQWLIDPTLGPEWKPNKCKIVLVGDGGKNQVIAHVDAGGSAWREPYASGLKRMAAIVLAHGGSMFVRERDNLIVVLPDRFEQVDPLAPDEQVVVSQIPTPTGMQYKTRVEKIPLRVKPA